MKKFLTLILALCCVCGMAACDMLDLPFFSNGAYENSVESNSAPSESSEVNSTGTSDKTEDETPEEGNDPEQGDETPDEDTTDAVALETLMQANDMKTLLSTHGNVYLQTVTIYSDYGEDYVYIDEYYYAEDDGVFTLDYVYMENKEVYYVVSLLNGAEYGLYEGDEYECYLYPEADPNDAILSFYTSGMQEQVQTEKIKYNGMEYVLNTLETVVEEEEETYYAFSYYFDGKTYILSRVECTIIDAYGESLAFSTTNYSYGVSNYTPNRTAYEAHIQAEDAIEVTVVLEPNTELEQERTYVFSQSSDIVACTDINGVEYALYLDSACENELWDLYDVEDGATIYMSAGTDVDVGNAGFEYTLSEEDLTEFHTLLDTFKTFAIDGDDVEAVNAAYDQMIEKYEYIETQESLGYLQYSLDASGEACYTESNAMYIKVQTAYRNALKEIYQSDSSIKDTLFAGWSDEELDSLLTDNDAIAALQNANMELLLEYYALENDKNWSRTAAEIYVDFVTNNHAIATAYGYDNYYEFGLLQNGMTYTKAERESFRSYVAEYILPLCEGTLYSYYAKCEDLSYWDSVQYEALEIDRFDQQDEDYLAGYFNSLNDALYSKMNAMFEKGTYYIGNSETAMEGAYTGYLSYYDEAFTYFGPGYQNLLTMVHELGHYAACDAYDFSETPLDLAETHSQANEWLFLAYMQDELTANVYEAYMLSRALNGFTAIVYSTIVDEFEEAVYVAAAERTLTASDISTIMETVCAKYEGVEFLAEIGYSSPYEYALMVVLDAPVYYLSYATSEVAAMSLYAIAAVDYAAGQEVYLQLQEDLDFNQSFTENIVEVGLYNPFAEETYQALALIF